MVVRKYFGQTPAMEIIERPALTVVGMQIETEPKSPEIPALWPKFVARIGEIGDRAEPGVTYGVMRHRVGSMQYTAAVAVTAHGRVPAGMSALEIPAGTYASFSYPLSGLSKGFNEIFNRLLPSSEYVQVTGLFFERYGAAFNPGDPNSAVEICIPVRRGLPVPRCGRTSCGIPPVTGQ